MKGNTKEILDIEKSEDTKILVKREDKLPVDITFKNIVILITCVIKDGNKMYLQLFLEEALVAEKLVRSWWKKAKLVKAVQTLVECDKKR